MMRTVVLEHTLPDGSRHFDWMVERPDHGRGGEEGGSGGEHRLATWRTSCRPDRAAGFEGEQIGDHRAFYLDFEGELTGGRGRVERVASGRAVWLGGDAAGVGKGGVEVRISWSDGRIVRYEGRIGGDGRWAFRGCPEIGLDTASGL